MKSASRVTAVAAACLLWAHSALGKDIACPGQLLSRTAAVMLTVVPRAKIGDEAVSAYRALETSLTAQLQAHALQPAVDLHVLPPDREPTCNSRQLLQTHLRSLRVGQASIILSVSMSAIDGQVALYSTISFARRYPSEDLEARGRELETTPHDLEVKRDNLRLLGRLSTNQVAFTPRLLVRQAIDDQMQSIGEVRFVAGLASYLALLQSPRSTGAAQFEAALEDLTRELRNAAPSAITAGGVTTLPATEEAAKEQAALARAVAHEMVGIARLATTNDDGGAFAEALKVLPDDVDAKNLQMAEDVAAGKTTWAMAADDYDRWLNVEPFNEILLVNGFRSARAAAILSADDAVASAYAVKAARLLARLTSVDTRGNSRLDVFGGIGSETFAVYNQGPLFADAAQGSKLYGAFGVAIEQRILGDHLRPTLPTNSQLWLGATAQVGRRNAEIDCRVTNSPSCGAVPGFLLTIGGARSVEASLYGRWEFFGLKPASGLGSNLYVQGTLGFLAVNNVGHGIAGDNTVAAGVILTNGALGGSYFQLGVGNNELLFSPSQRWKTDAFVSFDRLSIPVRPFFRLSGDFGRFGGTDSIQITVGASVSLIDLTSFH